MYPPVGPWHVMEIGKPWSADYGGPNPDILNHLGSAETAREARVLLQQCIDARGRDGDVSVPTRLLKRDRQKGAIVINADYNALPWLWFIFDGGQVSDDSRSRNTLGRQFYLEWWHAAGTYVDPMKAYMDPWISDCVDERGLPIPPARVRSS